MNQYQTGNATIIVHRPKLTEAEQSKSENHIVIALQQFGRAMQDRKDTEK